MERVGVSLHADAEPSPGALAVRCTLTNGGAHTVFALCLDLASGQPVCQVRFVDDPAHPGEGWAELYSGGIGAAPGMLPAFPARNAGLRLPAGGSLPVVFDVPLPVRAPELAALPDQDAVERTVTRLAVKLECAVEPEGGAPPAPVRGFDLHRQPTFVVESWAIVTEPLVVLAPRGNAP